MVGNGPATLGHAYENITHKKSGFLFESVMSEGRIILNFGEWYIHTINYYF